MLQEGFWKRLTEDMEALTRLPLVELAGENRILIENHRGIGSYDTQRIGVKMHYGLLEVTGRDLQLSQITAQQLVITGTVESILLLRG